MADKPLEEADILNTARAAGLDKAIAQFKNEVLAAAKSAADARAGFADPADATVEPWPAMKPGDTL